MQTFVINLDKDKKRLMSADAQLKRQHVAYERFPAIMGKDLSKEEVAKKVDSFRSWCCVGRKILPGEMGCALSHYALYQKMIKEEIPYACVLEDDVMLKEEFKATIERVERWLDPKKPQVILLSNLLGEPEYGEEIRNVKGALCTDAYIITLPAAKALLKENLPICVPCDHWGRWVRHGVIKLYLALPSVCMQNNAEFGTNISLQGAKRSMLGWVLFKGMRALGLSIDYILYKFQGSNRN